MGKAKFDYLGAKRDGYSDEEIQSYLEKSGSNFDLISAKKDGYSDEEIDSYLADNFSVGEVKKKETAAPTSTKAPVQSSAQSSPSSVSNKAVGSSQSSGAAQQKSSGGVVGYFKNMIQSANEGVKIEEEETKEQLKPVTQKLSKGNIGGEGVGAYLSGRAFAPKATKEQKSFAARKIVDRMAPSGLDEETRVKITEQVTPLIRDEDAFKVAKDEEDKAFVASAGYQDILAKNDQLLEKANRSYGRENAIAAVEQSRTGKVARFLTAALNGETINPQDEAYLMKYANPAYKQILASKKVNNLAEYAALRKPEVDQLRIQAAQQEVWPQIAQFKDVKGIGTELTTMPDYAKKLNEQEQKEIDAIGNKYPLQVERPVGFEGGMEAKYNYTTKRDSRYDKEVAQIKNKYQEQRDKAGLADAISFAANQYKTKQGEVDPLKVGEQMLKTTNPVLYAVYAKGGKKSKDFQQNLYKAGVDVMRNSGVPQLYAVAQEKEKQYDKLYPEAKEKDVIIKLAIEKFKRQGGAGTWVNSEFIEFDEGDELAKNLPAPLKAAWERVKSKSQYRSYNMAASQPMYGVATENYNRVKIPPIGGGINEFYNGLVSPIEGIANTIAGVFDSKEQSANKALQNNWIKQKLVDRDAIQSEIKQIESKKTLTTEDAKNLIELKSQLGLKSKGQEYVDLGMFTTGQVFGQGGLSSAGGRLVSNIAGKFLPSLSNFSKLEKGATWLKDIGNASKLAGAEVAYLSSYGDAKIEANRLMPDANEGWKMLYANIVGFANAGTEHIFPDQKILDALKKEVSPSIAALVNNLSRGNITEASFNSSLKSIFKNAFTKYLPQVVIEGRKEDLEELTTAIVTTGGKGFMVAMGAMDESQLNFDDEVEGWKQTIQQSAIGGAVPSVLGGISEVRRNTITKNTLYNLSKDPTEMDKLSDVIRYQQETGVMSERDAIDKLQTVSMLKDIGQRAMPVINEKVKLTEPDKAQLTTLLLAENKLQDQIANPNYKDVKSVLEGQLAEVQKQKDAIINGKVVIDDDLNAYTPEEWAKKNKAETQATQESSAAVTDLLNKQKQAKDDYIARNGNPKTKSEVEAYNNFQTEIATKEGVDTYLKNAAAAPQQAAATPTNKGIAIVTNTDGTFDVVKENGEKENFKTQQEADARVLELSQTQQGETDIETKKADFIKAGEQSKKDQSPKALGDFIIDKAQVGDRIIINEDEYYEVVSKKKNKNGHTETELQHFVKNEETGEYENNPSAVKLFNDKYRGTDQEKLGYRDASDLFESSYTNSKGEKVVVQSTYEPTASNSAAQPAQTEAKKPSPLQQLKQKKDALQKQSTEGVDVRQQAGNGEAMAEGNAKEQATTEEGEPAKGEETISSRVDEAVTIQVGGKAITGVVRQDEGGKLTVESGGKVIEVDNETPFVDYASPVRIADDGSGIEIGGEVFGEVSYETENGQEVALAKRADGTFKKITTPEIIEEIKYQGALKRLDEVSDTEAYRINKQYESERKTPQPAKEGTDKGDGGLRGPSQKAEKGQPATPELTDEERKLKEALDELDLIEKMADEELAQVEGQAKLVEVIPTGSKQPKAYLVKKNKNGEYSATHDGRKVKKGAFLSRLGEAYESANAETIAKAKERLKQQVADLKEEVEAKFYGREPKKKEPQQAAPKSEEQAITNPALKDVESTAKALDGAAKTKPTLWEKIKRAVKNVGKKLGIVSNAEHINNFNKAKAEWDKLSSREKKLKRADYELDDLHHTEGGYYKVGNSLIDLDLNSSHLKILLENNKFLNVLNKLGVTKIHGENRPPEEMFAHYSDGKIHLNNNSAFENIRQLTNAMSHELGHHEWTKLTKEERDYVRSLPLETGMAKHYEAQEKSGKGKETSASLQEENFADYVMQYFQGKLYGDEALLNKIPTKLREMFDNKYADLLKDSEHSEVAEAYHKAKKDGSNPELVKAVEELLAPKEEQVQQSAPAKQSPLQQIKEKKESGVSEKTDKEAFDKNTKQYKQSNGKKYGRKFKKKLPNGETVTGRYILVNKNDVFPSHDAKTWGKKKGVPLNEQGNTFNDNDYEKSQTARQVQREIASRYDRQAIDEPVLVDSNGVVKSGNGRTISRQLSTKESAKEYLDDLRDEAANFGFTEKDIDAIGDEDVMLAVELDGAPVYNTQEYAKFNAQKEKTKTPLQKARELSKRVSDVTINKIAKIIGDKDKIADLKNSEMLSLKKLLMDEELINKFNQDTYFDEKNNLTEAGKEFIDGLLLASVFDEQELEILSKFKHIRNRLARVKLLLAKNTQKGELSVLNDIKSAIRFINKVDPSQSDYAADINNYVAQYDIFEEKQIDRNDVIWAVFMHSQKDLEAALDAVNSVNREIDLWGDKETRDSAIDRAIQSVVNSEGYSNEKKQIIQYAKQQEQNRKNIQQREAERAKVGGSVEEREPKIGEGNIGDIQDNGREGEAPQLSAAAKPQLMAAPNEAKVYHGAGEDFTIGGKRNRIMFTSTDKRYADYYAKQRGGKVFEFVIENSKIAEESYVKSKIKSLGLKTENNELVDVDDYLHRLIDPRFEDTSISKDGLNKLFSDLENEGYYGIRFIDEDQDFGGKNEIESVAIFDPKKLSKSESPNKSVNESIKTLDELSNQIDEAKDTAAAKAAQAAYEAELKKDPRLNFVISNFGTITGQLEKLNLITKKGDC